MESQRFILFFVFAFSAFLLFDAWQRDQNPPPLREKEAPAATKDASVPPIPSSASVPTPTPTAVPGQAQTAPPPPSAGLATAQSVTVDTDVFLAEISTSGGDLRRLQLKRHRAVEDKRQDLVLFEQRANHVYVAQSGLLGNELPTHRTQYSAPQTSYKLADGANVVEVRLEAPPAGGAKVTKIYRFTRGSYLVDVSFEDRK